MLPDLWPLQCVNQNGTFDEWFESENTSNFSKVLEDLRTQDLAYREHAMLVKEAHKDAGGLADVVKILFDRIEVDRLAHASQPVHSQYSVRGRGDYHQGRGQQGRFVAPHWRGRGTGEGTRSLSSSPEAKLEARDFVPRGRGRGRGIGNETALVRDTLRTGRMPNPLHGPSSMHDSRDESPRAELVRFRFPSPSDSIFAVPPTAKKMLRSHLSVHPLRFLQYLLQR